MQWSLALRRFINIMRTRWNKALRDLWLNRTRSLLAVLAIALGVTGFGSVLSTYSILTRELNAGYLATNPASATLWTDRIDEKLAAEVRKFAGLQEVEERRMIHGRMRIGPNEWRDVRIFVIQNFANIRVSTLKPQKGKWPPSASAREATS